MGFGPMGFGVAGVLGAQFAAPERPCVSVCGDGAFFMHASVLGTAVEYNLPVVWVVWNNFAYASIRGLQRGYLGGRELATDFRHPDTGAPYNPDFAAMARSAGIDGVNVDRARRSFTMHCAPPSRQGDLTSSMRISAPTPIRAAPEFGSCRDWARASPPSADATSHEADEACSCEPALLCLCSRSLACASLVRFPRAAAFPSRMVKIIVPFPGGGINDVLARIVADKLQIKWAPAGRDREQNRGRRQHRR